jgi:hypothetical protein
MLLTRRFTAAAISSTLVAVPAALIAAPASAATYPIITPTLKVSSNHLTPGKSIKLVFANYARGSKITETKTVRQPDGRLKTSIVKVFLTSATGGLTTYLGAGTPSNYARVFIGTDPQGKTNTKTVRFVVYRKHTT